MNVADNEEAILNHIQISVIIPAYNSEKYISRCLESICNQTFKDIYEIIVVNDGSSDQTSDIVYLFMARHKNIVLLNSENGGVSCARNNGLKMARGRYVTFLDSDDYVLEDYLESLYDISQLGYDLVISDATDVTEDGHEIVKTTAYAKEIVDIEIKPKLRLMSPALHSTAWGCLYDKNSITGIEFDENLTIGEDTVFFFKSLSLARRAVYIPYSGYRYVQREQSAVHSGSLIRYWHESVAWKFVSDLMPPQSRAASEAKAISVYHAARGFLCHRRDSAKCCGARNEELFDYVNQLALPSIGCYLINGKPRSAATIFLACLTGITRCSFNLDN